MIRPLLSAAALLALAGCGDPQPQVYRVAINDAALNDVPATCYNNNTVPGDRTTDNRHVEQLWTLWHGADAKSNYLELPAQNWFLGNVRLTIAPSTVVGGPRIWTTTETEVSTAQSNTREELIRITFDQDPGVAGPGVLLLKVSNTNPTNFRSCEASLPFFARRIPYSESTTIVGRP